MRRIPFLLNPAAKDYLWGGSRLNDDFNFHIPVSPLAEAWMCSTHPDGESTVSTAHLSQVLRAHPEYLGSHVLSTTGGRAELPILIKLIDAKADLSVQVHPNDEQAYPDLGKTEMWYVLDAAPGSELVYGFKRDVEAAEVRAAIGSGKISSLLNHVTVKKDDIFFIEAGTVHAIGAGVLIAEIQESSNLTYRLYDYNRVDKRGQKRPLHVEQALKVAKLGSSSSPRQPMRVLNYKLGWASELLCRCKYFQVERLILNTEGRVMPSFQTGSNSFHALLVVDGCGVLFGDGFMLNFFKGDCVFVPAESIPLKLHGSAQILNVSC